LKKRNKIENFKYSAGSIDSLMKFVLANKMDTLLPYLAAIDLPATEQNKIVQFAAPVPYRSVGIVVHKHFVRKQILSILKQEIKAKIDPKLPSIGRKDKQLQPI
jgi:LysR family hydrogen peroxide-inducible transcriptional activator